MKDIPLRDEVYAIIGCAFEVFNELGPGFLEPVYQEAMECELERRGIPYKSQTKLQIFYKGAPLEKEYVSDLIVGANVMVELKAEKTLQPRDDAQLINYLKATRLKVGLLINFGGFPKLEWRRLVN